MSYDFRVYASEPLGADALVELVASMPGLAIASDVTVDMSTVFVPVYCKGRYVFTIDGPQSEDAGDIPPVVTAGVLGISHSYDVSVEGSEPKDFPAAWRFAKKLAKAASGVAVDLQTSEHWPKTSMRKAARPAKDVEIDLVSIYWYYLLDEAPADLVQRFLQLAKTYLPEALPRKHTLGPRMSETFTGNDNLLADIYANEPLWGLRALATPPILNFGFDGIGEYRESNVRSVRMDVDRKALDEPRWREALQRFFTEFADTANSFFASAEVARGFFWSGTQVRARPSTTEAAFSCHWAGSWRGLREWPQWWTWFGGPYRDLVERHLIGEVIHRPAGVFHSLSDEPLDRDALFARMPNPGRSWLPLDLTFTSAYSMSPPPAVVIPEGLRINS
ncbi:hypothetical protein [Paenarthrobacter ilicis]|uniref:hypothetical protein n=1 Tax=Paenarthrobacter ilicis TaxID=43665 RepID=UPI0028D2084E|nr:hypothetical protein [Paenarthrobacter ilicis]